MEAIMTTRAPKALGPYSQAIRHGGTVYTAGQIGLDPETMKLVDGPENQIRQVIANIRAICEAAGGSLDKVARLTVYLTDLQHWPIVNEVMTENFSKPYPARSAVGVATLPLDAFVEIDAIMVLDD